MSEITDQMRDERYRNASPVARHLYASPHSGATLSAIAATHLIPDEQYYDFVVLVGDVVLGLSKQGELPQLLQTTLGISEGKALKLAAELVDFLAPLTDPESAAQLDIKPDPDESEAPEGNAGLLSEIAETQAQLDAIQPIRTMEDDRAAAAGNEALVHHSSQEHIFGQRPVLGETPQYGEQPAGQTTQAASPDEDPSAGPRWDTEK